MLEQITYRKPNLGTLEEEIAVHHVSDLEKLSVSVLYLKPYIKSTDEGDDELPTFNFYNWTTLARFGETTLGVQDSGESHKEYARRMKEGAGITIFPTVSGGRSGY